LFGVTSLQFHQERWFFIFDPEMKASQIQGHFPKKNKNISLKEGFLRIFIENGRKLLLHTK
ncbi:hypothetical protein P4V43_25755, partial [Brevibacillus fortis]|uniref:hypothetical protein n=1 Tax=Brevibacillus fortis TaxID=2126352 RepID=UPI002E2144A0|nr:hypothetical protein [Brevibacillus fortis]